VATAVGGTPEVPERYPDIALVDPHDPEALRVALETVVTRIRSGALSRVERAPARPDSSDMLTQTERVLRDAAATR
jgi:hypothetical protein